MDLAPAIYEVTRLHCWLFLTFIALSFCTALIVNFSGQKKARGFALMTLTWVFINVLIALLLLNHTFIPAPEMLEYTFVHIQKWLGINIILDLFYGVCGWILLWQSKLRETWKEYLWGFGIAVLIQAGGLLILDLLFFARVENLFNVYLGLAG